MSSIVIVPVHCSDCVKTLCSQMTRVCSHILRLGYVNGYRRVVNAICPPIPSMSKETLAINWSWQWDTFACRDVQDRHGQLVQGGLVQQMQQWTNKIEIRMLLVRSSCAALLKFGCCVGIWMFCVRNAQELTFALWELMEQNLLTGWMQCCH